MDNTIYCFTKNLICHHDDYYEVVNGIRPAKNIKFFWPKVKILLSRKKVIFMDIDTRDLKFVPFMVLRSLWGAKSIGLSVSTEYLKNSRTLWEFITKRGRNVYLRSVRNRILFWFIKYCTATSIYSIHKDSKDQDYFARFVKGFFYDVQLWDVDFFRFKAQKPAEIDQLPKPITEYILFLGTFDERRSRTDFMKYVKENSKYNFILACIMPEADEAILKNYDHVFVMNRFITNEELFYLMTSCNVIYCFYTNQRPSGFFGRAMQLSKYIIVRKGGFLSTYFSDYGNLLSVSKLDELDVDVRQPAPKDELAKKFDDMQEFKRIMLSL